MHRLFRFSSRTGSAFLTVLLLLMLFATSACGSTVVERTVVVEVIKEVKVVEEVEVTREVEVKVQEIVEVVVTATPTPAPTATPLPVATPTPEVDDYFVVIGHDGSPSNDSGSVYFYASYPFRKYKLEGISHPFNNEAFYLEYLRKEGVITSKQKDDYFDGEPIQKIPLVAISTATWKLFENDPYNATKLRLSDPRLLTHYADEASLGSGGGVVGGAISLDRGGGYVSIDDGKISVSAVDGNITTTVNFEGVGAEELLDYWLSQNKITVEQIDEYGRTGQIEFSLKDGVDYFGFGVSADGGGVSFEVDEDVRDLIVNDILPLFVQD